MRKKVNGGLLQVGTAEVLFSSGCGGGGGGGLDLPTASHIRRAFFPVSTRCKPASSLACALHRLRILLHTNDTPMRWIEYYS